MSVGGASRVAVGVLSGIVVGLAEGETNIEVGDDGLVGPIWPDPPVLLRISEVVIHRTMIVITRTKAMTNTIRPRITFRSSVDPLKLSSAMLKKSQTLNKR